MAVQLGLEGVLSALTVFDVTAQDAHLVFEMLLEIETELLCQSQLAVVIIQALLAHSQHFGSLLEIDFLAIVVGFVAGEVQSPPALHQVNGLGNSPLSTTHVLSFSAIRLEVRLALLAALALGLFLAISDQDHRRLHQISREEPFLGAQLAQRDKVIGDRVIESDAGQS